MHISLTIYALNRGLYIEINPKMVYKRSPFMFFVNYMSTAGNVVSHATVHLEAFFMAKNENRLFREFEALNSIFAEKLNCKLDLNKLRVNYLRRVVIFFTCITVMSIGSSFFSLSDTNTHKYLFLFIRAYAVTTIRARGCYIALILNIICEILRHTENALVEHQRHCTQNWNELPSPAHPMADIQYYREIYTKMWKIKNLISSCKNLISNTIHIGFNQFDLLDLGQFYNG